MIERLTCWWKGHKRGKRLVVDGDTSEMSRVFECPRCGAQWTRKVYPRKLKVEAPE